MIYYIILSGSSLAIIRTKEQCTRLGSHPLQSAARLWQVIENTQAKHQIEWAVEAGDVLSSIQALKVSLDEARMVKMVLFFDSLTFAQIGSSAFNSYIFTHAHFFEDDTMMSFEWANFQNSLVSNVEKIGYVFEARIFTKFRTVMLQNGWTIVSV